MNPHNTMNRDSMKYEIELRTGQLSGKRIWGWGRASDLTSFQFGPEREVTGTTGKSKTVGEYALHIQCPWRITAGENIVVGHREVYYPVSGDEPESDFDWGPMGSNRLDQSLDRIFKDERKLVVQAVEVGVGGYLRLYLSGDLSLEVFPDDSLAHEHWRLFRPYTSERHLVVTGKGIEEE